MFLVKITQTDNRLIIVVIDNAVCQQVLADICQPMTDISGRHCKQDIGNQ